MRIAVIGDVHGNLLAFEAVLAHARAQAPDVIVQLGDWVVGYPDSRLCWELARTVGGPMVRGNHERYLFETETPLDAEQYAPVLWSRTQFSDDALRLLRGLPVSLQLPGIDEVLFMHAAPHNDRYALYASTPDAEIVRTFGSTGARLCVRGHNHIAAERHVGTLRVVTNGAVALTLDGHPEARYSLLDRVDDHWHIAHQRVAYDDVGALRRFRDSGWLRETGVIGRLYYDEARMCNHMLTTPFFGLVKRGLSLPEAYERMVGMPYTQLPPL
jgi:predicted phosphodiesterase